MNKSLSDDEMRLFCKTVVIYPDLKKISPSKFLDMLPMALLYLTESSNSGHWVLIHRVQNKQIEFFDSYGIIVDKQMKYADPAFRYDKYLAKLLLDLQNMGMDIAYSPFKYQEFGDNIATCGRHCITRRMFESLDAETYHKGMMQVCKLTGLNPDEIAVKMTDE